MDQLLCTHTQQVMHPSNRSLFATCIMMRACAQEVESIMQKVQILIVLSWMDKLIMYRAILDYVMYMSCEKLINNCSAIVIRVFQHPEKTLPASMPSVTSILSIAGIDTVKFDGKMRKSTEI